MVRCAASLRPPCAGTERESPISIIRSDIIPLIPVTPLTSASLVISPGPLITLVSLVVSRAPWVAVIYQSALLPGTSEKMERIAGLSGSEIETGRESGENLPF